MSIRCDRCQNIQVSPTGNCEDCQEKDVLRDEIKSLKQSLAECRATLEKIRQVSYPENNPHQAMTTQKETFLCMGWSDLSHEINEVFLAEAIRDGDGGKG